MPALILLAAVAWSAPETPPPSCPGCSLVVIALTNLRYDRLSSNGYDRAITPNLDAFASSSVVFTNAYTVASWTLPSAVSMYSSLYPFQHGVMSRYDGSSLDRSRLTLLEKLKGAGFRTAAFTGGFDYAPAFGLTDRFDHHAGCAPPGADETRGDPFLYGRLACVVPKALEWIEANAGARFFVLLQAFDAHCPFDGKGRFFDGPYEGPVRTDSCYMTFERAEGFERGGKRFHRVHERRPDGILREAVLGPDDVRRLVALYDEEVAEADERIGGFLRELARRGLEDRTLVVVVSEHGDLFGEHGRFMRAGPVRGAFYEEVLHVPLMFRHPGLAPRRVESLASLVDFAPTVSEALGLAPDEHWEGVSLAPALAEGRAVREEAFAGSKFTPALRNAFFAYPTRAEAVRRGDWKLIRETVYYSTRTAVATSLFDLAADPVEARDLSSVERRTAGSLEKSLDRWRRKTRAK